MFFRQATVIRTISLLSGFSLPCPRVVFQRKRAQLVPLLVAGFFTLILILFQPRSQGLCSNWTSKGGREETPWERGWFCTCIITLTSLPCESILFIPDLPRPRLLLHGVLREMWLLCLAVVPMCHPFGNLPHLPFIFALWQLFARAIPFTFLFFSFLLHSDIFQSGFWTSDEIEDYSVHGNHIQSYEQYCCDVQLCCFSSTPFSRRLVHVFAAYHR